jgi:hypothetical protein
MSHPYARLSASAFWRSAVASRHPAEIGPVWQPRQPITPETRIATFGSCFAQNLGRALRERGHCWVQTEPPPAALSAENARRFSYDAFSCRTGNIYTTPLLLQWTRWALGLDAPPGEVWRGEEGVHDPFRPAIEPGGFASAAEMLASRKVAIAALRRAIAGSDCLVFTLGLIEGWWNRARGIEYPMCPGTAAGAFDPALHEFRMLSFAEVLDALERAIGLMRGENPALRFILTVSPVPLTATAGGEHVLLASTEAKSVLRAVAGQLARQHDHVEYFPAYELISAPPFRGMFFEPNLRTVSRTGVELVMDHFFGAKANTSAAGPASPVTPSAADIACEEELLASFAPS